MNKAKVKDNIDMVSIKSKPEFRLYIYYLFIMIHNKQIVGKKQKKKHKNMFD
jgi:hypothetical protein